MHSSNCHPRVVAEEYLDVYADGSLAGHKVHVFIAGDPIVLVCRDRRGGGEPRKSSYDAYWRMLPLLEGGCKPFDCPRPEHREEVLRVGNVLAERFVAVRVDWYEAGGRLRFSKMTFTQHFGAKDFESPEWTTGFGRRNNLVATGNGR